MPPDKPEPGPLEHLRIERRSYIIGTLVVWAVILAAMLIMFASMEPQIFAPPRAETFSAALKRASNLTPLTPQQQLLLEIINLVGAVALFILNWRFSFLLRRPRWAFVSKRADLRLPPLRWLWWVILALVSMFYFFYLVPQLILTWVLAHLGTLEIRERQSNPPPPPAPR